MGPSESSCQSSRVPKNCGRHPKFGAERELRASTWGFASRLDAPRVQKKPFLLTQKKVRAGWRQGFCWYERAGERPERTQAVGLKDCNCNCNCNWLSERVYSRRVDTRRCALQIKSDTAAGRRAGLPIEIHPKFESAEPMAVQNPARIHPKFELASQSVVIKKAHPKL